MNKPVQQQPVYQAPQQPVYQQPQYAAPQQPQYIPPQSVNEKPVSVGGWIGTILLTCIPCVGLIMMFVWAFGNGNTTKKNWARAGLIFMLIAVVITLILVFALGASLSSILYYF